MASVDVNVCHRLRGAEKLRHRDPRRLTTLVPGSPPPVRPASPPSELPETSGMRSRETFSRFRASRASCERQYPHSRLAGARPAGRVGAGEFGGSDPSQCSSLQGGGFLARGSPRPFRPGILDCAKSSYVRRPYGLASPSKAWSVTTGRT